MHAYVVEKNKKIDRFGKNRRDLPYGRVKFTTPKIVWLYHCFLPDLHMVYISEKLSLSPFF